MKKFNFSKNIAALGLVWAMLMMPMMALAQTRINMPKNDYKVQDDVKVGREASVEVEQRFPILNDSYVTNYVQDVGNRLVAAIPSQFQQPAFQYRFQVVNARDINAFALPGGPMYINRGMISAAKNEGEMAGVMAHEIAHIALRHGTAQASKQNNLGTQLGTIGLIIGGAILGGQTGAQLGGLVATAWQTKYSREYESQADILGSQIMARAGYDPRDLAGMFQTIERQSGGNRAPEFLSSHPNPQNRYAAINREAQLLRVSREPIKYTRGFQDAQSRLGRLPQAPTMAEIERGASRGGNTGGNRGGNTGGNRGGTNSEMSRGNYSRNVELPSSRMRVFQGGNFLRVNVPVNWQEFPMENEVWFAPNGAYGNQGITHGALIGVTQTRTNLEAATEDYVNGITQVNNYLRQTQGFSRTSISGRRAYATQLAGRSPITGQTEIVTIYTTQLRDGNLFYMVAVAPQNDYSRYNSTFSNMIRSIRLNG
ncbi:MAG: M48 family metalloprotease [Aridibacter sp.]